METIVNRSMDSISVLVEHLSSRGRTSLELLLALHLIRGGKRIVVSVLQL